ncbi:MAG TPA: hypothetical protein VM512_10815 [Burkholderiaceae bacterium]|jgi:hypothetical protein|nr:hypothetical protein [Burkholderiaceae bacterium]
MNNVRWLLPMTLLVCGTPAWSAASIQPVMVELVDDGELAAARGKYLGQFVVTGFMVEMATQWLNHEALATASARLTAAGLDRGGHPEVSVNTAAHVNASAQASSAPAPAGVPNLQISGLGQVSQIAGDGNSMANVTTIAFQREPLPAGGPAGATMSDASSAGYRAHAAIAGNTLLIGISTPSGVATQAIQSRTAGGAGNLMQTAQIVGHQQQVVNQMSVQLQIRAMSASQLSQIGIGQALEAVSMMRR